LKEAPVGGRTISGRPLSTGTKVLSGYLREGTKQIANAALKIALTFQTGAYF